jgi:phosphoglycerate-specific signal transduction histidine kinase
MLFLIIAAVCVAIILTQIKLKYTKTNDIDTYIKESHKYSGIAEELYSQFFMNIQLAREHINVSFLYKAIDYLNEIPMYMSPMDQDVQWEIAELGQKIINAFENEKRRVLL